MVCVCSICTVCGAGHGVVGVHGADERATLQAELASRTTLADGRRAKGGDVEEEEEKALLLG